MANNQVYKLNIKRYGTHRIVASLLGKGNTILDVGCSSGYLATLAPGNKFFGIDSDNECLKEAEKEGYKTQLLDLNQINGELVWGQRFKIIVFVDVLEHLKNPEEVGVQIIKQCLERNGTVIISLPNVAHFSTRIGLMLGKFDYQDAGILDRTHLHLYTLKSALRLAQSVRLRVTDIFFSSDRFGCLINKIPVLSTLLGYNIILVCKKF